MSLMLLALFCIVACDQRKGTFIDTRDGKKYKTVIIGRQIWMAENLNYAVEGSKCYENDSGNCKKYGRLYDWEKAMEVCPKFWHLPSDEEWKTLVVFAGGNEIAGKKLKAKNEWKQPDEWEQLVVKDEYNGIDEFGFSALPGGAGISGVRFGGAGYYGFWWSSRASESNSYRAYRIYMDYGSKLANWDFNDKRLFLNVRCLQY